jgi:hypothetical protein
MRNTVECVIDGCERAPHARNYCCAHYKKLLKYGDPNGGRTVMVCSVGGCGGRHSALGLCSAHYFQHRRRAGRACVVDECLGSVHARGLCNNHYQRDRRRRGLVKSSARFTEGQRAERREAKAAKQRAQADERRDYVLSEFRWLVDGGVPVARAMRAVGYQHGAAQLADFYRNSGQVAPRALRAELEWRREGVA